MTSCTRTKRQFFGAVSEAVFRFKLVYDMHSSLPQQLTNFRFTTSKVLIGVFRRLERMCLRNADAVITICPDLQDYALAMGIPPERHVLIENSIFEDVRVNGADRSAALHLPGATTEPGDRAAGLSIAYAGTFEHYQGLDLLLSAFAHVRKTARCTAADDWRRKRKSKRSVGLR